MDYTQTLDDHGVLASVGSVGDAYDNALAESFVDSFKTELVADRVWQTRTQLELAVVAYIGWFNHQRLHESLGDIPPAERVAPRVPLRGCETIGSRRPPPEQRRKPINTVSVEPGPPQSDPDGQLRTREHLRRRSEPS
jgi:putative transposase